MVLSVTIDNRDVVTVTNRNHVSIVYGDTKYHSQHSSVNDLHERTLFGIKAATELGG